MMVTEKMREAGSKIASDLMSAQVSVCMGGLGGSQDRGEFEASYSGKNMDLIRQYISAEIDSVTAIYIAMARASGCCWEPRESSRCPLYYRTDCGAAIDQKFDSWKYCPFCGMLLTDKPNDPGDCLPAPDIKEGKVKKGGVNVHPKTPPPSPPKGQGGAVVGNVTYTSDSGVHCRICWLRDAGIRSFCPVHDK